MPRTKNSAIQSKKNGYNSISCPRYLRNDTFVQTDKMFSIDNDVRFTLSILVFGLSYSIVRNIFNFNGIEVCSEKTFYKYQNIISPIIIKMAKDSAKNFSEKIENNTIISIDGAWDHRRHGSACIVTFIDLKTRKIIDFEISLINKQFVKGNTKECSRNLEKVCMERLIERWKNSPKIKYYIHDNDGVTRSLIEKSKWNITEILDVGHALKSFKNNLDNSNKREGENVHSPN